MPNVWMTGLLGVVFVVLKLTNIISWSWWCITLPFWGLIVLALLFFAYVYTVTIIKYFYDEGKAGKAKNKCIWTE